MKALPTPKVPGNTEAERMSNALRMVLKISKADMLKKEARLKRARKKKRAAKKLAPESGQPVTPLTVAPARGLS